MVKIKINEYILNKYGVRISSPDSIISTTQYNTILSDIMKIEIPQITSIFAENESDDIDATLDKFQILLDSPTVTHARFEAYMNRYTYNYENCLAKPKRVVMTVIDPTSYLFDDKYPNNRTGVYTLTANMGNTSDDAKVEYITYTSNADNSFDSSTLQFHNDANIHWDSKNRLFTITLPNTIKFLQNCRYNVDIYWHGSDFIDLERDVFKADLVSFNQTNDIHESTELWSTNNNDNNYRSQMYLDKYKVLNNILDNWSIVSDNFKQIKYDSNDLIFRNLSFSDSELLIISNARFDTQLMFNNISNVILINCALSSKYTFNNCAVTFINCTLSNSDAPQIIFNQSTARFNLCNSNYNRNIPNTIITCDSQSSLYFNKCNFNITSQAGVNTSTLFKLSGKCVFDNVLLYYDNTNIAKNEILTNKIDYVNSHFIINKSDGSREDYTKLWEVIE